MPRAAKAAPFSRCKSATSRVSSDSQSRAPAATGQNEWPASLMGGRLPARTSDIKRSMVPHRLRYQIFHCLAQQRFARIPRHAFAANLEHGGHRKRRDPVKRNMPDSSADPLQKAAQASDVDQAGCGVGEGSLEENMVGLMLAEHVVDQIGRNGHLPAGLLLPRMAALDQP